MTVQEAISELRKQVIFTEVYFPKDPALRSYAKALSMAIEALKAIQDSIDAAIQDSIDADIQDSIDADIQDSIDADIQAADMAAEDMPDNEEIPFC